ncbi:glycosyltransferase family 2 protein [Vibrio parahaemolyticus]|uniref:glycosyltransferase family 2 protein n=1 Tax=Vibrio parahaemolyticus TaxID=670 RepID=UPI001A8C800F|nr:glycosyltransferase family 2 protein [Vibrio parahaemolyticus]EJB8540140.1 glycosyltransferase family 2 protein [Vibrio parahaemolyticus]MBO0186759.1 glycosyltransferase family 2 protein [Vibrio parahaemolyticus]MBO0218252.1 glycosyltransferase family 2 protein [Vibrio parahaemolyticus]MBY4624002.1 glycosyltransferase family 2 protein [Vibrio parahaemolyticus]MCR9736829.1 glycosyltransferase family 2 protein [Vibrio parahaemolyticus]
MSVYISVVSHNHSNLINELGCLRKLALEFKVVIKSNTPDDEFDGFFELDNLYWINNNFQYGLGFGKNNNLVYNYCCSKLDMNDDDLFIILNPDVLIDLKMIKRIASKMEKDDIDIAAINLYKDSSFSEFDNSIRNFPTLLQFAASFLGFRNRAIIDKGSVNGDCEVDWAAGSFLAFRSGLYKKLRGFDENYFMYCEDIDICYRSSLLGSPVTYFPQIKAVHLAKHANRNVLSKHFIWHVKSVLRFLFSKIGLTRVESSIE